MALGTIISRITGFVRGILIVAVLGTTLLADTYNVANTMPNILYNLLVGGALTAIFIPQLVRSFDHEDGGDGFASRLITTISIILFALVAVGMYFAPALVRLYAPEFFTTGFETEQEIAIAFTRYCLPQIFFLGLFTMLGQVANARGSFGPLMWAPIANNLVGIALFGGFLIFSPGIDISSITSNQVALLGWGTTFSVVVQALVLVPVIRKLGISIKPKLGVSGLGKSFNLAGPKIHSLGDLVRFAGRKVGCSRLVIPIPASFGYLQAWMLEIMPGKTLMSRDNLASMKVDNTLPNYEENALEKVFGISPQPLEILLK